MPRYTYKCNKCDITFTVFHGIYEKPKCKCGSFSLEKKFNKTIREKQIGNVPGRLTKEYIEDNKQVLKDLEFETSSEV